MVPREWASLKEAEDIEFFLLKAGAKPAAKLEDLDEPSLARLAAEAKAAGLVARAVAQHSGPKPGSRGLADPASGVPHTLYLARQEQVLSRLIEAEAEERLGGRGRKKAQMTSGELLGYPDCCRRSFAELERQDDLLVIRNYHRVHSGAGPPSAASPYLNFFPPMVSPVTWFPCTLTCHASISAAKTRMALLQKECAPRARAISDALDGVVLAFDRFAFVMLHEPRKRNGWLHFSSVSDALSFSGAPGFVDSTRARDFRTGVTAHLSRVDAVRINGDKIELGAAGGNHGAGLLQRPVYVFRFPAFEETSS